MPRQRDVITILGDHDTELRRMRATLARVAGSGSLTDLGDVTITTPATGDVLEYDGAEWVNVADLFVKRDGSTDITAQQTIINAASIPHLILEGHETGNFWAGAARFTTDEGDEHWDIGMRGASGSDNNDLLFEEYDGSSFHPWLKFDLSADWAEFFKIVHIGGGASDNIDHHLGIGPATTTVGGIIVETIKGGNTHIAYFGATDSNNYLTFDSGGFHQWRSFNGTAYTTEMQLDTTRLDLIGVLLDLNGNNIEAVGELIFSGTDVWSIDSTGGDDYQVEENGAVRYRIRDDDNDGYIEWFGTSGTELARIDGAGFGISGTVYYYDVIHGQEYTQLADGSNYWRVVMDNVERGRFNTVSRMMLSSLGAARQSGGYGYLEENSATVTSGNASSEIYHAGMANGNNTNVSASGTQIFSNVSNRYKKKNFDTAMPWLGEMIDKLMPLSFEWRDEWNPSDKRYLWFTVEDVQEAAESLDPSAAELFINRDPFTNEPNDIASDAIIASLVRNQQTLGRRVAALEAA